MASELHFKMETFPIKNFQIIFLPVQQNTNYILQRSILYAPSSYACNACRELYNRLPHHRPAMRAEFINKIDVVKFSI